MPPNNPVTLLPLETFRQEVDYLFICAIFSTSTFIIDQTTLIIEQVIMTTAAITIAIMWYFSCATTNTAIMFSRPLTLRQNHMLTAMFGSAKNFQIFRAVVRFIFIFMVDMLISFKRSTEHLSGDNSMFPFLFTIWKKDFNITAFLFVETYSGRITNAFFTTKSIEWVKCEKILTAKLANFRMNSFVFTHWFNSYINYFASWNYTTLKNGGQCYAS